MDVLPPRYRLLVDEVLAMRVLGDLPATIFGVRMSNRPLEPLGHRLATPPCRMNLTRIYRPINN